MYKVDAVKSTINESGREEQKMTWWVGENYSVWVRENRTFSLFLCKKRDSPAPTQGNSPAPRRSNSPALTLILTKISHNILKLRKESISKVFSNTQQVIRIKSP